MLLFRQFNESHFKVLKSAGYKIDKDGAFKKDHHYVIVRNKDWSHSNKAGFIKKGNSSKELESHLASYVPSSKKGRGFTTSIPKVIKRL